LDEIGFLIEKHHAKEIFDDTGTFPTGNWLKTFCEGMIRRGYNKKILFSANMRFGCLDENILTLMKKAGFRKLKMGLESANQNTLNTIHKGITIEQIKHDCKTISKAGIDIHLTVMVGYPWETKNDAINTYEFIKNLMKKGYIEMLQSTIVIPYPGTPLYTDAVKKHWLTVKKDDYEKFDMSRPILKTSDVSSEEIKRICRDIYALHFNPYFIFQHLRKSKEFRLDIPYLSRGIKSMIGHIMDFGHHSRTT